MRMSKMHDRIRDAVQRAGRSKRDISRAAGLSPSFVSDLLSDESFPRADKLRALAQALGVSAAWLLEGHVSNQPNGLAEHQAERWQLPPAAGQRPDVSDARRMLIRALAPHARTPETYRMGLTAAAFGLLEGDVLIVDLKGGDPKPGEIVLATVADLASGAATTIVRRYMPPYLVSADPKENETPLVADGARTVILGRVVASFRAPQLDA